MCQICLDVCLLRKPIVTANVQQPDNTWNTVCKKPHNCFTVTHFTGTRCKVFTTCHLLGEFVDTWLKCHSLSGSSSFYLLVLVLRGSDTTWRKDTRLDRPHKKCQPIKTKQGNKITHFNEAQSSTSFFSLASHCTGRPAASDERSRPLQMPDRLLFPHIKAPCILAHRFCLVITMCTHIRLQDAASIVLYQRSQLNLDTITSKNSRWPSKKHVLYLDNCMIGVNLV